MAEVIGLGIVFLFLLIVDYRLDRVRKQLVMVNTELVLLNKGAAYAISVLEKLGRTAD